MSREIRVGALDDLPDGKAHRVELDGRAICVVRIDGAVHAIDDVCSHEDYSLSEGEIVVDECAIECWKHGSLFSLESGEPLTLPATRPVAVYEVVVENGEVTVLLPDAAVAPADGAGS